jgi:hypothetical protein
MDGSKSIASQLWTDGLESHEAQAVRMEVDADAPTQIALHTYLNDEGSVCSFYFDREAAVELAAELLRMVRLDG